MKRRDVFNFCQSKRVRLWIGSGLGGEMGGHLELLSKKKGKVRVRVGR